VVVIPDQVVPLLLLPAVHLQHLVLVASLS
jgi:hypothetical protein